MTQRTRDVVLRVVAVLLVLGVVPAVVAVASLRDEAALVVGEPSPRDVVADRVVGVVDEAGTQEARDRAFELVEPVEVPDVEASAAIVSEVAAAFEAARDARQPVAVPNPDAGTVDQQGRVAPPTVERVPAVAAQVTEILAAAPVLGEAGARQLAELSDTRLSRVESDTVDIAQTLAQRVVFEEEVSSVLDRQLPLQIGLRSWPGDVATRVVEPLLRSAMRPTWEVDTEATARERQAAAERVEDVVVTFGEGEVVVAAGEVVTPLQLEVVEELGQVGSRPGLAFLRAFVLMATAVLVGVGFVRRLSPTTVVDAPRMLVLASLVGVGCGFVVAARVLSEAYGEAVFYAVPFGGVALLATVITGSVGGVVTVLPLAAVGLLVAPTLPGVAVAALVQVLLAVQVADRVTTRTSLRRATFRLVVGTPLVTSAVALVLGPRDAVLESAVAGVAAGLVGIGIVQGLLPTVEAVFRLATVTSLLDLADRNHPLLRELEEKALGSYNHSVQVASLTERACRAIGANELLGTVAALYHDIGKIRQPAFFIENQRGRPNPHDEIEPRVSAVIIQRHVQDGVELATEHRLPPEVVDCIGSHHGTMVVSYFYRQALAAADGDESAVDKDFFRYKGGKPRSKEAAVLVIADCCEATTRSMAMDRGTLPRDLIESTVDRLVQERLDDHQFDECELTFRELQLVRDQVVEALTGIYHPRIAYPPQVTRSAEPVGARTEPADVDPATTTSSTGT